MNDAAIPVCSSLTVWAICAKVCVMLTGISAIMPQRSVQGGISRGSEYEYKADTDDVPSDDTVHKDPPNGEHGTAGIHTGAA